jgi:hypothetical protein
MQQYLKLESEKYFRRDIEEQMEELKHHRNRKALRDFVTMLVGIALIPVVMLLAYKLPVWFPEFAAVLQAGLDQILPSQISTSLAESIK